MKDTDIRQNSLLAWVLAARPKTLTGAAVPVMIGMALAYTDFTPDTDGTFSTAAAILCFLFAFIMQIDANFINDFFDCLKGADESETRLGPLRACSQGWVSLKAMRYAIALTTCLACAFGLPLVFYGGLEMILVGAVCVLFCFLYTTHLAQMGLGDILVIAFFGIVPVCVSYYIQIHTFTWQVFIASVACGLVIDGLLIVNNFRDRDNDRDNGKNTIVVRFGARAGSYAYLFTGITAFLLDTIFWLNGHFTAFILPLTYLVLHFFTYLKMVHTDHGKALNICLGETARNIFIYGLTVTLGLLL